MAAAATARTRRPSAGWGAPPPRHSAKPATTALPKVADSQNRRDGRSWASHLPAIAVASGRSPITTAPCAAGAERIAHAEKSGKPTTTPPATTASRGSSAHPGHGARWTTRTIAARTAATTARPRPTNTGSSAATARRVAGRVRLKLATPTNPNASPVLRSPAEGACKGLVLERTGAMGECGRCMYAARARGGWGNRSECTDCRAAWVPDPEQRATDRRSNRSSVGAIGATREQALTFKPAHTEPAMAPAGPAVARGPLTSRSKPLYH